MSTDSGSIESIGYPLAFEAAPDALILPALPREDGVHRVRTMARALAGMQKEALIQNAQDGTVWRVVCDEGPWLNGTDLAPFPLAFFAAGLASSMMTEVLAEAIDRGVQLDSLRMTQDNFFTMEGSALRGTMRASVQPMQVNITIRGNTSADSLKDMATSALQRRCPAVHCLHEALTSGFAVRANGDLLSWPGVAADHVMGLADPAMLFDQARPVSPDLPAIISKSEAVGTGAGDAVGLQTQQKRVVHVRSECSVLKDGLKAIEVQCIQPAGSRFLMLSDDTRASGGQGRAPDGLAYLAAGAAFCFMTQIGRYAQIVKQELHAYRIIQDTVHRTDGDTLPGQPAIETLVVLDTAEPAEQSIKLAQMGEQTCYVHAAFRTQTRTELDFNTHGA